MCILKITNVMFLKNFRLFKNKLWISFCPPKLQTRLSQKISDFSRIFCGFLSRAKAQKTGSFGVLDSRFLPAIWRRR